jgi:ketosteroid isomerase-like protein
VAAPSTLDAIGRYLAALNDHDADGLAASVTADFVNEHTSAGAVSRVGRQPYREAVGAFLAQFQHLHYEVEDTIVDGDRAAVAYTMTAVVDRRPVSIRGIFRFRVRDGLVAHRVDYWDGVQFQRQIGES